MAIACTTAGFVSWCSALMIVVGHADAGDAPRADAAAPLQVFERRDDLLDVLAPRRREGGALVVAVRVHRVVVADVGVQEEHVDAVEAHRREARVERRLELPRRGPARAGRRAGTWW